MTTDLKVSEFSDDELARYEKLAEASVARRIAIARRAIGLRDRPVLLRCVSPIPVKVYSTCTADNFGLPAELKCGRTCEQLPPDTFARYDDYQRESPGHTAGPDPDRIEGDDDKTIVSLYEFLVTIPAAQEPVLSARGRVAASDAEIVSIDERLDELRRDRRLAEAERGRRVEEVAMAERRLQEFLEERPPEWRARALAGRPSIAPTSPPGESGDANPNGELERARREFHAGGFSSQSDFSLVRELIRGGSSLEDAKVRLISGRAGAMPQDPRIR